MFPFIETAYAMAPRGGEGDSGGIGLMLMMASVFAIFYFLMIRPQQKRAKEQKAMNAALAKGDEVVTDSGIYGTIQKIGDDQITLEIAPKVSIRILRSRVAERSKEVKGKISSKGKKGKDSKNSDENEDES